MPNYGLIFKPPGDGGAARYVSALAEWFELPVHVLYLDERPPSWREIDVNEFGRRKRLPLLGRRGIGSFLDRLEYGFWRPPEEYDTVISSGLVAKETVHHPHQKRVHLAHGFHRGAFGVPVRDRFSDRRVQETLQKINRLFLRSLEKNAYDRVDYLVANSEFTAEMIGFYFDREADEVIHPPVDVDTFYSDRQGEDFYLYLGGLYPYKGVQQIVEAFNDLPYRLVVAGEGGLKDELRDLAGDNVELVGYVSEERKRELMAGCRGFVQNSVNETFGVTTVEALASGAPVVAVNNENNPYIVTDGVNGVIYESSDSAEPLREAVEICEDTDWNHDEIQETASKYDVENCRDKWIDLLDKT